MVDEHTGKKLVSPLDLTSKTIYILITAQTSCALSVDTPLPENDLKSVLAPVCNTQSVRVYYNNEELAADIVVNNL